VAVCSGTGTAVVADYSTMFVTSPEGLCDWKTQQIYLVHCVKETCIKQNKLLIAGYVKFSKLQSNKI
jgi:hypothetical protein